jgi:hypothetical protein
VFARGQSNFARGWIDFAGGWSDFAGEIFDAEREGRSFARRRRGSDSTWSGFARSRSGFSAG